MTYEELLEETAARKRGIVADLDAALKGPAGFLVEAEIRRSPGKAAWFILAKEFCEKLAEHIDEFIDEGEDVACEVQRIYMAYEDGMGTCTTICRQKRGCSTRWNERRA